MYVYYSIKNKLKEIKNLDTFITLIMGNFSLLMEDSRLIYCGTYTNGKIFSMDSREVTGRVYGYLFV